MLVGLGHRRDTVQGGKVRQCGVCAGVVLTLDFEIRGHPSFLA
jgi:hypothetical protein